MNLKQPLNYEEQVEKLISHGIIISNKEKAIDFLKRVNYYRFTGYALQFRKKPNKSDYVDGTTFESIYNLYEADESFRDLFRVYIEKIEVYFRTQISYGFSMRKCINQPYDQHYNENNFYDKKGYNEVFDNFNSKNKRYYKDTLTVKHHKSHYNNKMPLWVMVELMSFSDLSKLYKAMYISEKKFIASALGISYKTLENHLYCLTVLRNKCAHGARLYNTQFYPPAILSSSFLKKNPTVLNKSLFAYVLVLLKRLPDKENKCELVNSINSLIKKYEKNIDMSLIGFPDDYLKILNDNC